MTTLGGADREYEVIDRLKNQTPRSQQLLDKLEDTNVVGEIGGLTTEIGTGIALDTATAGLLVAPVPGSRLAYGAINFAGGAISNYAAQRIRGEEDTDWGEVISSGLLGIIPGMGGKAGKFTRFVGNPNTYKRAITSGAATGVADQVIRQGWNEQRLPTVGEVTTGAVAGGTLGPIFKKSFDEVGKILSKYSGKTAIEINEKLTTRERSHLTSLQKKVLEVYQKGDPKELAAVVREFRRSQFNFEKLQGKYKNYKDFDEFERATNNINNKLLNNLDEITDGDIDDVLSNSGVIYPPGSKEEYIQQNVQALGTDGVSENMQAKVNLHNRALNDEMLQWDRPAVARRSKIDEQFELDKFGKPEGPHPIYAGSTEASRRAKAAWSLGEEVDPDDIKRFEESTQSILDGYNWHLHDANITVGKTEGHHKGVVRQIFDASNGLNKKYRIKSAQYMQKRIGFELGYHGRNAEPVPEQFHPRVHAIINSRVSSSPDKFNVEGIAQRLGFPKNWQEVLTYEERLPLYNELADAIRESVDAINLMWRVLLSRSDDLGSYSKDYWLDLMLQHNKLDKKLRQIASPSFMAQTSRTGWGLYDTSTDVLNDLLAKSRKDLMLPMIGKVEPNMAPEIKKILYQTNGWAYLKEVLRTNKSAETVMKAYPGIKVTKKQLKTLNDYSHMLRSRGQSIPPVDSIWNQGQDN